MDKRLDTDSIRAYVLAWMIQEHIETDELATRTAIDRQTLAYFLGGSQDLEILELDRLCMMTNSNLTDHIPKDISNYDIAMLELDGSQMAQKSRTRKHQSNE